ncbi:SH3 domain-containing protein [Pseudoruegeria sp. HB172150]|uniref:SH3 domain-containing protein n=1 Tax=Pseudoruegeria sp. HB172150 TaxID=2721164 RepID=UPI001557221A|nr:SH3 domain-containing protein [Pseudoruegeria sp. HB172150]
MVRVARPWKQSYDPALRLRAGETVTVGAGDDEFPGWTWCENADGLGGWVPAEVLSTTEPGPGQALHAFDTCELTVSPGDELDIQARQLGWALCRSSDGTTGWVPLSCFDEDDVS